MILSDIDIRDRINKGDLIIESNLDVMSQIGPASFDFRLGNIIKYYDKNQISAIDPKVEIPQEKIRTFYIEEGDFFVLHPGQFVLGVTQEKITVPDDLVARCEGRSSLGRLGLIIHSTAGFIDPGFSGTITLEITNINEIPVKLYPGMRVGQFAFELLNTPCEISYAKRKSSKYMNQTDTQVSKLFDDKDF